MIVDSSIIIDYLRGRQAARTFLDDLRSDQGLATHVVVAAEVLAGARNRDELVEIEKALNVFSVVPINEDDSFQSVALFKSHRLVDGVGWLDCLIAATCLRESLPIATLNDRHFRAFDGLQVMRPY
jgi:predicted nucleic acid-binding protein